MYLTSRDSPQNRQRGHLLPLSHHHNKRGEKERLPVEIFGGVAHAVDKVVSWEVLGNAGLQSLVALKGRDRASPRPRHEADPRLAVDLKGTKAQGIVSGHEQGGGQLDTVEANQAKQEIERPRGMKSAL